MNLVAVGTSVQTVPNVVGMTQSAAAAAITGAGLSLGHVTLIYSGSAPSGTVTDQAPNAGVTAPAGSQVAITVSRGPTPSATPSATAVPSVTGQSQSQAIATLQSAGLCRGRRPGAQHDGAGRHGQRPDTGRPACWPSPAPP